MSSNHKYYAKSKNEVSTESLVKSTYSVSDILKIF